MATAELAKVLAHYSTAPSRTYKFAAYKHPDAVQTLNERFSFKCAYCESKYAATQPVDIEHYRPKGAVVDDGTTLGGYYWLAAEWSNLLPSCIDCNRPRRHRRPDGSIVTAGKANFFPIANRRHRATTPGSERRERPLLLNPCSDDPERHLMYDETGMICPRKKSRKGATSIELLGLFRPGLVTARRERLTLIEGTIARIRHLLQTVDGAPSANIDAVIARDMDALRGYAGQDAPYAGMARQLVRAFLADLDR